MAPEAPALSKGNEMRDTFLSRRRFLQTTTLAIGGLGMGACRLDEPAPAPLRILILGGTGFVGPNQVRSALARGHEVTLFNRGVTNPDLFPDLETLIGDRDGDLAALALFGSFAAFALFDIWSSNRRGAAPAVQTYAYTRDAGVLAVSLVLTGALIWAHPLLFGVAAWV